MDSRNIPELNYLLTQVEKRYGRRVATTTDFEALSVVIERETGELLSSSTLKRLWGVTGIEKCSKNGNGSATKSATIVQQNR